MSDERLTDEQVRAMIPQGASLYVVVQGSGLALALRELLKRRAQVAELEAELEGERARVESWKVMEQELSADVEKWYARVAELEAENARVRVHDVRVEGGAIVGLGELLEGEG